MEDNDTQKPIIIKIGGSILKNPIALDSLFSFINKNKQFSWLIVHGGGNVVDSWLNKMGYISKKHDGLRISSKEEMPIIVGALAGYANKKIMKSAIKFDLRPIGLSLFEAGINVKQKNEVLKQTGFCDSTSEPLLLTHITTSGYIPIICSIGFSQIGEWFNVNADEAATAIAKTTSGKIVFLTDVSGVLDQHQTLIQKLNEDKINDLVNKEIIKDGMTVKVKEALKASKVLKDGVYITGWQILKNADLSFSDMNQLGTLVSEF